MMVSFHVYCMYSNRVSLKQVLFGWDCDVGLCNGVVGCGVGCKTWGVQTQIPKEKEVAGVGALGEDYETILEENEVEETSALSGQILKANKARRARWLLEKEDRA